MLLVDTADNGLILEALKFPAVRGFTTNPTLMAHAAGAESLRISEYIARARELCHLPKNQAVSHIDHLMIQAVGSREHMLEQAAIYSGELKTTSGTRLWIKLPPTQQGIACCPALKKLGCATLVTAVYTATQALVAMEAGADGIAVYLGRMMRLEDDWEAQLERIAKVVSEAGKMLLLASFPDIQTVERALDYSRDLTVPPNVLQGILESPHSEDALKGFDSKILK
ncbi:MAG TPA: transaldolase family protein [Rhodopila sp.]